MAIFALISVLIFILGTCVGSFLSVVIYRIQTNSPGIVLGHSFCSHCKKGLRRRDMIPILSYIWLRGRCFFCRHHIPASYPLLELMTGLVFIAFFWKFPFISGENFDVINFDSRFLWYFLWYTTIGALSIAIFWYDLQTQQIPSIFLWILLVISIIGRFSLFPFVIFELVLAVIIALVFFGGQYWLSGGRWLGSGDVYLGVSMALIVSWPLILAAISLSYIIGTFVCIPMLFNQTIKKNSTIAFGPFLIMGLFLTIFFGEQIVSFYQTFLFI